MQVPSAFAFCDKQVWFKKWPIEQDLIEWIEGGLTQVKVVRPLIVLLVQMSFWQKNLWVCQQLPTTICPTSTCSNLKKTLTTWAPPPQLSLWLSLNFLSLSANTPVFWVLYGTHQICCNSCIYQVPSWFLTLCYFYSLISHHHALKLVVVLKYTL
jgi:hypothetical protein